MHRIVVDESSILLIEKGLYSGSYSHPILSMFESSPS